jgi:NTP pyrophosphatase (non-canonical NTP hydrolase)
MTCQLLDVAGRVTAWLDGCNGTSDAELGMRILKIAEETGEVVAAWFGATGQNPRKGRTHTRDDVAAELADVVTSAVVAMVSLGHDPAQVLTDAAGKLAARLDTLGVAAHECAEHLDPLTAYTSRGLAWAEYGCRACGDTFAVLVGRGGRPAGRDV